ncbi:MAG TPA: glycosyltransferase, partial [Anaeromyxobacteraceae bacterium]|nr:glycosyltransferase [Anaeromyxobacteraceae bacterium]
LETVLEAMRVLRRFPGAELAIAGNVPTSSGYGAFVRARIARLGLAGRVKLLGYLDAPSLAAELATSHAYVIASTAENSPNSLCEAQAVGTPCVASYAGGIPSLVEDGRTGLLSPPGDAPPLAAQLERVLDDDLLAARLSAAAREEAARRHDRAAVVAQLLGAYRAVVGGAPTGAEPLAPARTA